jgi:hypothetical protein
MNRNNTKKEFHMKKLFAASLVLVSFGVSISALASEWKHFWVNNSHKTGPSPALQDGISIRLSYTNQTSSHLALAQNLYVDVWGVPQGACSSAHLFVTNRTVGAQDRLQGFRERIWIPLIDMPEGHCSAEVFAVGTFVDDPTPGRNRTPVGLNFPFVLQDNLGDTIQTLSLELGRKAFVGAFQLPK